MKKTMVLLAWSLLALWSTVHAGENPHRIGLGLNYWVALEDIEVESLDDHGYTIMASYQYRPSLLGLELDVEFLPDLFGDDAIAPQAYFLVGKAIYAAAGIGWAYTNSEWQDDPFFAFKAGLDLEFISSIYVDIFANYRFNSETTISDAVDNIDIDTLFLGVAVRLGF